MACRRVREYEPRPEENLEFLGKWFMSYQATVEYGTIHIRFCGRGQKGGEIRLSMKGLYESTHSP